MLPPTSYLPPLKKLGIYPLKTLNDSLYYLREIYNPEVRGYRRRRRPYCSLKKSLSCDVPDNIILSSSSSELDRIRTDTFERSYAIKWLASLISHLANVTETSDSELADTLTEDLIQNVASLLAICAGSASAGVIVRQFVFENSQDDIQVELRDVPLDNHDFRSVGAQTWGSACIMAEMMVDNPYQFGFQQHHLRSTPFRCLELGAGTGLVSLTLTKIIQKSRLPIKTEIIATDYYPSVLTNLERNIYSNFPQSPSASIHISTQALDWSTFSSEPIHESVFETPFDLILGADVIYEPQHALWIKSCLTKLLRKPSSITLPDTSPTFHLVIPLRATHTLESNTIEQVFPFNGSTELVINHKEIIICDAEGEGVEYAYYKIGWAVHT